MQDRYVYVAVNAKKLERVEKNISFKEFYIEENIFLRGFNVEKNIFLG